MFNYFVSFLFCVLCILVRCVGLFVPELSWYLLFYFILFTKRRMWSKSFKFLTILKNLAFLQRRLFKVHNYIIIVLNINNMIIFIEKGNYNQIIEISFKLILHLNYLQTVASLQIIIVCAIITQIFLCINKINKLILKIMIV